MNLAPKLLVINKTSNKDILWLSTKKNLKNWKDAGIDKIPSEVWKTREFIDIQLQHSYTVYNQNTIDGWKKGCILPFHKKDNLRITKNYWLITLATKIYNVLLCNRI